MVDHPKESRSRSISRRLPQNERKTLVIKSYAQQAGELLFAWNELQSSFAMSFSSVLNHNHPMMALTIWNALASDSAQRDILLECIDRSDGLPITIRDRFKWAVKQANKLSTYRNDIVHSPIGYTAKIGGGEPNLFTSFINTRRWIRHSEIHLPTLLKKLTGDF